MTAKKKTLAELSTTPRNYKSFITQYMSYVKNMEAPNEFHLWTALSVISGALGGKCFFDMGHFKWKPNQFIILVAPPGVVSKSTTSGVGYKLLQEVPGINFGPGSCTWQALLDEFEEVEQKYKVGRTEKTMSVLNMQISELGTFLNFNDTEMIDTIVDIWDADEKTLKRRTKGGGVMEVKSPWLNLMGCTTPSWVSKNIPEYAIGGGFVSRTIFVYADEKQNFIAYPSAVENTHQKTMRKKLIEDLSRISLLHGEFKMTDEAREWGTQWYVKHNQSPEPHLKTDLMQGYAARKQAHLHKVAMCLCAAEGDDMVIQVDHMKTAFALLNSSERNMRKVFKVVSDDREVKNLDMVTRLLLLHPEGLNETQIRFKLMDQMSGYYAERAIQQGIMAGILRTKRKKDESDPRYALSKDLMEENFTTSPEDKARLKELVAKQVGAK
ncbi:hypothetical protein PVS_26 [Vibrio phage vB_VspS_VS-ABTNL-3]|nr:hypothetical protein PVS_26 [Vibrio phage vB_VspS_VS-ABTNL-3]